MCSLGPLKFGRGLKSVDYQYAHCWRELENDVTALELQEGSNPDTTRGQLTYAFVKLYPTATRCENHSPPASKLCVSWSPALRVQVPNNRILIRDLYWTYSYPNANYLHIGYLDPLGCIIHGD